MDKSVFHHDENFIERLVELDADSRQKYLDRMFQGRQAVYFSDGDLKHNTIQAVRVVVDYSFKIWLNFGS